MPERTAEISSLAAISIPSDSMSPAVMLGNSARHGAKLHVAVDDLLHERRAEQQEGVKRAHCHELSNERGTPNRDVGMGEREHADGDAEFDRGQDAEESACHLFPGRQPRDCGALELIDDLGGIVGRGDLRQQGCGQKEKQELHSVPLMVPARFHGREERLFHGMLLDILLDLVGHPRLVGCAGREHSVVHLLQACGRPGR